MTQHNPTHDFARASRRSLLLGAGAIGLTALSGCATGEALSAPRGTGGFAPGALDAANAIGRRAVDEKHISGFVSAVWRRGELALLDAYGKRSIENNTPMQTDSLFRIASMSKPLTSTLTMQLIEEGRIGLDDSVDRWLPELANRKVLRRPDGPLSDVYDAPRAISVRDLLTHRAGLIYGFFSTGPLAQAYNAALPADYILSIGPDEFMRRLQPLPLATAPGEHMVYSVATDVLGVLCERVLRKPFADALKERVIDPLGMRDTAFYAPPEKRARLADLYSADPTSPSGLKLETIAYGPPSPPAFSSGGGGLVSSATDYLQFIRMQLGDGAIGRTRILKPETVRLMRTDQLTPTQHGEPFLGRPGYWERTGFALGLSVKTAPGGPLSGNLGAFSWPGAFGTWWQADPVENMATIFLTQSQRGTQGFGAAVAFNNAVFADAQAR